MRAELNLISNAWLPVRRASGAATIRPAEVADLTDPVLAPDWPRPDFRVATLEFLIGLLATACPPEDERAWRVWWRTPPTQNDLDAAFAPYAHAFSLDGDGPRFMQDHEDLVSESEPVERLLIEAPGGSTVSKNTDLLVKRARVASLGRPTAAMALHTFQSWAPAGGAGNRTGLRGGGPLVTLVVPGDGQERRTLWHLLWANVPVGRPPDVADLPRVFPWLAPTILSTGGRGVTPEDAHPLQAFWGTPRRIRLDFGPADSPAPCGLTGVPDIIRVTGWRQRPSGANYLAWGGRHPLSPHYRVKPGEELLPVHPQPGGIGYRHWLGLVAATKEGLRAPAAAIATWRQSRAMPEDDARLLAAGYDMDNMKARSFIEAEMPLPGNNPGVVDELARDLVVSAGSVAVMLRGAVRAALFAPGATVKAEADVLSTARERLWSATEGAFHAALRAVATDPAAGPSRREAWARTLRETALAIFDEAAPLTPEAGGAAPRLARARRNLLFALLGYGKDGGALFATLRLEPPKKAGRAAA